jgi:hypothetical protein
VETLEREKLIGMFCPEKEKKKKKSLLQKIEQVNISPSQGLHRHFDSLLRAGHRRAPEAVKRYRC